MRFSDDKYSSRTIDAIEGIKGHQVREVSVRPDCRRFRLTLDDGSVLLLSIEPDLAGAPHLDADLVRLLSSRTGCT